MTKVIDMNTYKKAKKPLKPKGKFLKTETSPKEATFFFKSLNNIENKQWGVSMFKKMVNHPDVANKFLSATSEFNSENKHEFVREKNQSIRAFLAGKHKLMMDVVRSENVYYVFKANKMQSDNTVRPEDIDVVVVSKESLLKDINDYIYDVSNNIEALLELRGLT